MFSAAFVARVLLIFFKCSLVSATTTTNAATSVDYSDVTNWYCPVGSCLRRISVGSNPTDFDCFSESHTGNQCGGGFGLLPTVCECVGQVKRGIYETDRWSEWIASNPSVACSDSSFQNIPDPNMESYCWCDWLTSAHVASVSGTAVSTSSGSGLEQVTCVVESFCTYQGSTMIRQGMSQYTSIKGLVTQVWTEILRIMFSNHSGGVTIIDGSYVDGGGDRGRLSRNNFRITPASPSQLPDVLVTLDAMDREALVTDYEQQMLTRLQNLGATNMATLLGYAIRQVSAVACGDTQYPTSTSSAPQQDQQENFDSSSASPMAINGIVIRAFIAWASVATLRPL